MKRPFQIAAIILLPWMHGMTQASAWTAPVPDVVLYCTPAMNTPLERATHLYTERSQIKVHIFTAPPNGLMGLLKHRARDDVVVADEATMRLMAFDKLVRPESVVPLGHDPFVLISKVAGTIPAGLSAAQLVEAYGIVRPDPTAAASFDGAALLRAAFPAALLHGEIGTADTLTVVDTVRRSDAVVGLVQQSEAHDAGVTQLGIFPVLPMAVSGGLVGMGQSENAKSLLDFLAGHDGEAALRSAGLEQ